MRTIIAAALCGVALGAVEPTSAGNSVAQAIQKLHLSAQQLLSVRDFLGPFGRGTDIEASGTNLFVLRDSASMNYSGEFSIHSDPDGSVEIERVAGPATLDFSRSVTLPLKLDRKSRAQVLKSMAGAQAIAPAAPSLVPAGAMDTIVPSGSPPPAVLPAEQVAGLKVTNPQATGAVSQAKATFYRDGSGYVRSFRAQIPATDLASTPLRVSDKYFSPVQSDGVKVYRAAVVEVDSDIQIAFADLEMRYGCDLSACKPPHGSAPVSNGNHLIKWSRVLVAAVPAQLLAQIAPPPAPSPPPSGAAPSTVVPPAPGETPVPAVPDKSNGTPDSSTPSPTGGG